MGGIAWLRGALVADYVSCASFSLSEVGDGGVGCVLCG
jgi:hypothetical protein